MATAPNTNNTKLATPSGSEGVTSNNTAKQNYTAIRYGNDHGSVSFGHIHKQGETTADVMLQASDGRHSIILDKEGPRKGSTQITAPGRISIESAIDKTEAEETLFIHAHNGNIAIIASNGKIRLQGTDIELIAVGEGGSKGNVRIKANSNIELDADNNLVLYGKASYKLATAGSAEVTAASQMQIYSSLIRGVTDAVANKDSKVGGRSIQQKNTK
jgi:hypothetical protein